MNQIEADNQISQLTNKVATLEENLGKLEDQITRKNECLLFAKSGVFRHA